jgi:thiamine-monophosphate kinase
MKELDIIHTIARTLPEPAALADDAFVAPEPFNNILTTDLFIEGRHFDRAYFSPYDIGWKSVSAAVSDIAATGGQLGYVLISLGLPEDCNLEFVSAFYEGVRHALEAAGASSSAIAGGDTVSAPVITVNVTAIGSMPAGHTPGRRWEARPGDVLIATGQHGMSTVGYEVMRRGMFGYPIARQRHLRPVARIQSGLALSGKLDRYALMDSSDGLADAILKIAEASQVHIDVYADRLPVHPDIKTFCEALGSFSPLEEVLYGGEDFELVATVPTTAVLQRQLPPEFAIIGRVTEGPIGADLLETYGGKLVTPLSLAFTYQHFNAARPEGPAIPPPQPDPEPEAPVELLEAEPADAPEMESEEALEATEAF